MDVQVNPQTKKFWLAFSDGWKKAYGHEIKIGRYSFSICVGKLGILVSDVSTGMAITVVPRNILIENMGETKEGTLNYYESFVAPFLLELIEVNPDIEKILADAKERLENIGIGEMPPIEDIDDSFITELISEIKH